jgi:hypothetical protein
VRSAAVGFRAHSGWSALVALCLKDKKPVILSRQRVELVEIFTRQFRQPYHAAAEMPLEKAADFIAQIKSEAEKFACQAIESLQAELKKRKVRLVRGAVLAASGRPLPPIGNIVTSHALIHTADGELFREALANGCQRCGLTVLRAKEKQIAKEAAEALRMKEPVLLRRVTELGRPLGSPWSRDQKYATLAAWLALAKPATRPTR